MGKRAYSKVPQIRFKNFDNEWTQKKLGECVLIQRGGSPRPIENYITHDPNGINWIKIGDVRKGSRYITKTDEKIKPEGVPKTREVYKGDLILSNSMSFGRPYLLAIDGCIHDGWLLIRNDKKLFDLDFLLQLLSSEAMAEQYRSLAAGGVVNNLNSALVQSTNIAFPDKNEQSKIGDFFRKLDQLIELHQGKHDKLLTLKKAMHQKMFPQPGSYTPVIRFKGFTGKWEKRLVSSICSETYGGGTPSTSKLPFWVGTIPWIQSSDITDGDIYKVAPRKCISDLALRNSPTKLVPKNSIAIVTRVGVGKLALIEFSYTTSQDFLSLSKLVIDPSFAAAALSILLQSKLHESQGTSIKGITKEDLLSYSFNAPKDIEEQQKIGTYFRTLDELISKHNTQIQKLKQIKSACLEKMFV